ACAMPVSRCATAAMRRSSTAFYRSPASCAPRKPRSISSAQISSRCCANERATQMMHVLIALVDVGSGVQLEEALVQAGIGATWDSAQAEGPRGDAGCDVVVLDADHLGKRLAAVTARWREQPALPGVVAIGASQAARDQAPHARITLLAPGASPAT